MDGERVTNDEARVDEVKAVVEKPEAELPVKSPYDDFVEGVATREIALGEGGKPEATARVFRTVAKDGEPVIHIAGEGKVVTGIGDVLERGGYRVQEWHIKRPDDPAKEAEKVRPALAEMLRNMPATIGSPEEILKEAKGLPLVETPALTEAGIKEEVDKLAEEGSPFQKLGEDLNKAIEGGSEDGEATS